MEPSTRVFGAALLRLDGDEDLAPRVLAMADRRRWAEVHAALVQMGGEDGRLLWFGSSLALVWSSNDRFF